MENRHPSREDGGLPCAAHCSVLEGPAKGGLIGAPRIATPVVVGTGILQWPRVLRFLPDQAALSLLGTPGYSVTALPTAAAALALTIWAAVCLAAYAATLIHRDA